MDGQKTIKYVTLLWLILKGQKICSPSGNLVQDQKEELPVST